MARKLRGVAPNGTKYVVHFDRDWREWQVRAYKKRNGIWKFAEGPTYYSHDKEDAVQTFYHLVGHGPAGTHVNPKRTSRVSKIRKEITSLKKQIQAYERKYHEPHFDARHELSLAKNEMRRAAGTHVNPPKSLVPIDKTIIAYGMAVVDGQGTIHWTGGGVTHCGKAGIRTAYRTAAEACMKHAAKIHDYKAVERIAHAMHASGL